MMSTRLKDPAEALRKLLLALVLLGCAGLAAELFLLEHYENVWQWAPFGVLAAGIVTAIGLWLAPTRRAVRFFQGAMLLFIVAGVLGLWLHFKGNTEWELESDPGMRGMALAWEALRGATPTLAPGALLQLGLLGLILTYRHPALQARQTTIEEDT